MPIYEYECRGCGSQFELFVQRSTDIECPECRSKDLKKLLSVFAVGSDKGGAPEMPPSCGQCGQRGDPGTCPYG